MRPGVEEAQDGQCICQCGGPVFYRADLARASSVATAAAILGDRALMQNATFHDVAAVS